MGLVSIVTYSDGVEETLYADESQVVGALTEALEIFLRKNADYNREKITYKDYHIFGRKSSAQFLYSKALRLVSLCSNDKPEVNESFVDTLLDIIVYAAFGVAIQKNDELTGPATANTNPQPAPDQPPAIREANRKASGTGELGDLRS